MVNSMVDRATSDMLIGPDWAMNIEICDMLNRDLTQSKDVVKGLKKRVRSKNPKVQLLALTLLETIIKNCGEVLHMHVAEKDLPHEMVRIAKKKPDLRVKEKILVLIDTWQEAFGGPRARYPQFYAAYQELLRAGAVFPQRTEGSAPLFTPPQTQPLGSFPQNLKSPENRQGAESSAEAEAEFPTLSLTEIQNAKGIMDVLAEMLTALDPSNKEGLRQDVILDLVKQCRTYKQRVVHLVNSTSDESMLCQGLALNDDLQRLLAKHEALASGTVVEAEKTESETERALVNVDAPLIDTGDSKPSDGGSTSNAGIDLQLLVPATTTNGSTTASARSDLSIDLLSGDFASPSSENTLALVPIQDPQSTSPVSNPNNALALMDMFNQTDNNQPQHPPQQNIEPQQGSVYPNGVGPNMMASQYEQSQYPQAANPWNGQLPTQQEPPSPGYDAQTSSSLPLPPWEAQPPDNNGQFDNNQYPQQIQAPQQMPGGTHQGYQPMGNDQVQGMYMQQPFQNSHMAMMNNPGMYPQQMPNNQMAYMYPPQMYNNQMAGYGYGYGQQQNAQYIDQRISGLSVRDDNALRNSSYQPSTPSHVPSGKPMKAEDKLFGDLVDITKFKPTTKTTPGRTGSM